ncbi:hypothetical protein ACFT7S_28365 [Streptomyces sp. NPDC057136]
MTESAWVLAALIALGLCLVGWIAVGWAADRRITARTTRRRNP